MGHFGVDVYRYSSRILHFYEETLDAPRNIFKNFDEDKAYYAWYSTGIEKYKAYYGIIIRGTRRESKSTRHIMPGTLAKYNA